MTEPVMPTAGQVAYWIERDGCDQTLMLIGGPEEAPDVIPCPALVADQAPGLRMVHVALTLNEIELAQLARGGTLWLTCWGGLPIHLVEVIPHEGDQ